MTNFLFLAPFRCDSVKSLIQLPIFNYLCLTPRFTDPKLYEHISNNNLQYPMLTDIEDK